MSDTLTEKPVPDRSGAQSSEASAREQQSSLGDGEKSGELKIVILGITGTGKSSVGNTLLNNDCFPPQCSPVAVTADVNRADGIVCGRNVTIIDTPGILDPNRSEKDLRYEIVSCLTECAPGPHVFLLVFKVDRLTPESMDTVKKILDWFGEDALKHTVVLFTHGDNLDDQMTIQDFLDLDKSDEKSKTNVFKSFVKRCGNRVHVIDNKRWKSGEGNKNNCSHISQLMETIDVMVRKNEGKNYTNKTLEILARAIDAEVENIKKELEEAGEMQSMSEIKQRARDRVKDKALRNLSGIGIGVLVGTLLGVAVGVSVPVVLLAGLFAAGVNKIAMKVKSSKSDTTDGDTDGLLEDEAGEASQGTAGGEAATETDATGLVAGATVATGVVAVAAAEGAVAAATEAAVTAGVVAGGIGAGVATCIGIGVVGGIFAVAGAVKGGMKGAEAVKRSDNAKEAAKNAAQSAGDEAKKIFQRAWEAPQKLINPKQPQCQQLQKK